MHLSCRRRVTHAAMEALAGEGFDLILLDLGLPDMDGKLVIKRIREWSEVPVIVLSARHLEDEKIAAFDLGADDYVNKPFAMGELMARLRAAQRGRERRFSAVSVFKAGALTMDLSSRRVWVEDEPIHLTPKEYDLARTLARFAGRVVTHRQIATAVWGGVWSTINPSGSWWLSCGKRLSATQLDLASSSPNKVSGTA